MNKGSSVNKPTESVERNRFTVVMRGPSTIVFPKGIGFRVENVPTSNGPASVLYTTRWLKRGHEVTVPGQLWIEVNGFADDVEEALAVLPQAGVASLAGMSVACNATMADPDVELAFKSSPRQEPFDFFQAYIFPETNELKSARLAHPEGMASFQTCLTSSKHAERLLRAANQYRMALQYWRLGSESLSVAHLWMALEALTKIELRDMLERRNISDTKLAVELGIEKKELDPTIRRKFLLNGDEECYSLAKKASDGFEHGHLGFDEIRVNAFTVHERLARYIRHAIFRLSGLEDSVRNALVSRPYDSPIGAASLTKFVRGTLHGDADKLAPPENMYPFVKWNYEIKRCEVGNDGALEWTLQENLTPELGEGTSFRPATFQIWKGGSGIDLKAPPQESSAEVIVKTHAETSGKVGDIEFSAGNSKWAELLGGYVLNCNTVRHLALFWLERLTGRQTAPDKLANHVKQIIRALSKAKIEVSLRHQCVQAWNEAVALDEMRLHLVGARLLEEGLIVLGESYGGNTFPSITDFSKLAELSEKTEVRAKELAELLVKVDDFRVQPNPVKELPDTLGLRIRRLLSFARRR